MDKRQRRSELKRKHRTHRGCSQPLFSQHLQCTKPHQPRGCSEDWEWWGIPLWVTSVK